MRRLARIGLELAGLDDRARHLLLARTARGRRGLRDDRQLRFFLAATLAQNSNCIDVGAHDGAILQDIVRAAPAGSHAAFEPIPSLAEELAQRFPGVELHNLALADEDGETTFQIADVKELSGMQQREWLGAAYEKITVPVRRLDNVIPPDRRVDFLKVDVEGAQVLVLRGAQRILSACRPAIWFEHGRRSAAAYGTTSRDMWDLLVEHHGYRVWTADGDGPLDLAGFMAANDAPMWTFMAHQ